MQTLKVIKELRRLFLEVGSVGEHHLSKVEADLIQTDVLLDEAISSLTTSFSKMYAVIQKQQEEIDLLLSGKKAATPENLLHLSELRQEINTHINAMVTGMQFQDMTSQLLERIVRRVNGLRDTLSVVGDNGKKLQMERQMTDEQLAVMVDAMLQSMEQKMSNLETILWRSVRQTRMESGDIDLF